MTKFSLLTASIFMVGFYGLMALIFGYHSHKEESLILRDRFGTIMWHSSDKNGVFQGNVDGQSHIYCYYPTKDTSHEPKGEYIIKKEDAWVSEREKLWWENS